MGGHSHSHASSAERRFGIRSFVFEAERPFSRNRFMVQVQAWQQAWKAMGKELQLRDESAPQMNNDAHQVCSDFSPFSPVLRSKGLLWVDTQVTSAITWSQ